MKSITLAFLLLLAGCASTPTNTQQTGYTSPEPGFLDYLKGFGELAGELVIGLASAIADNSDSITGAMGAYSDTRSGGGNKADAYSAAAQALQNPGATAYGPSTGSSAGICNRDSSQLSLGEFKMCAIQDCRAAKKTPRETSSICINCDGQWTRCYRSASSAS